MNDLYVSQCGCASVVWAAMDGLSTSTTWPRAQAASLSHVRQGMRPTCHLLAAAIAVEKRRLIAIEGLFKPAQQGWVVHCFTGHQEGQFKPRDVLIQTPPRRLLGVINLGARNRRDLGGTLLEEAFAATFGRGVLHHPQDAKHALSWLTGRQATTYAIERRRWAQVLFEIGLWMQHGQAVVVHSHWHSWAVLDADLAAQTLQIQDPLRRRPCQVKLTWLKRHIVALSCTGS